jgi:hypothetical protein
MYRKEAMGINQIVIGLIAIALLLHVSTVFFNNNKPNPTELPWVPIQVGKTRSFHSQTRDAGMFTEASRRRAIIRNPNLTVGYKGSTNGSLEWNFLTGICVCPPRVQICPDIFVIDDGGNATSEVCDILDGDGDDVLDFGDANTNVCAV